MFYQEFSLLISAALRLDLNAKALYSLHMGNTITIIAGLATVAALLILAAVDDTCFLMFQILCLLHIVQFGVRRIYGQIRDLITTPQ